MKSLGFRSHQRELMDDASLDPARFAAVLHDLSVVNRWTLAARPTLSFLARGLGSRSRFRLLDVGFGYGDMLRTICRWAAARGITAELVGVDQDPRSAAVAAAATNANAKIEFRTGDYRDVQGPFDFVVSSLVAHHMSDREIVTFIRFMERTARHGWLINDLHRCRAAVIMFPLLTLALGVDRIVRSDGVLSIARSFRSGEWEYLLRTAGLPEGAARLVRYFPFRLCVERLS